MPNDNIETILEERQKTHGEFSTHAEMTQELKLVMQSRAGCVRWNNLTPSMREALEMIVHKIGRILNGNPNHKDHWDDIAGYATLVSREL